MLPPAEPEAAGDRAPEDVSALRTVADVAAMDHLAARLLTRTPRRYELRVKPAVDRVLAACALVVCSPLVGAVAVGVWWTIGRPVLYGQRRAGLRGEPFTMLKFRTMDRRGHLPDRDRRQPPRRPWPWRDRRAGDRRRTHKTAADPRHTRIGRWLRRTSLDELPQLVNVLRGDMSLVGPRPELHELTAGFTTWQQARHLVRPGLTGLWQVTRRGDGLLLHECIDLDLHYIDGLSAVGDLRILLRTPAALLRTGNIV